MSVMFGLDREESYSDRELDELESRMAALDTQVKELFQDLGVTPEEITAYISKKENFTKENWEQLQKERQKLDQKLKRELENIPDPRQTKKSYEDRNVASHWLYVR